MKRNILNAVLASALALGSSAALALPPSVTPDVEVWASGSSATDNLLKGLFDNMCQTGTLDSYYDNSATPGSSYRAYFCTVGSPTFATPKNVLLHKMSVGGSTNGVAPVADGTAITQMVINNAGVNGSARTTPCALTATANTYSCSFSGAGETVAVASDIGLSDVEPAMFRFINTPTGGSDVTPAQIGNLAVSPLNAVVFGVTVNTSLRNRLQFAQNLTVGAEDAANMPSLTHSQIAAAFSGSVVNWTSFRVSANHPNAAIRGLAINDAAVSAAAGTATPANTQIQICRRAQGSGTQAQFNAVFLRAPCIDGGTLPAVGPFDPANPGASCPSATNRISMCSSTGNLTTCMNSKEASNNWAFGIHSTENVPKATDAFRFIRVNGVTPEIQNAADSRYEDWAELTTQWRSGPGLVTGAPAPTGDVLTVLNKIKSDAATGSILALENTKFVQTWGQGGYLATPSATNVPPITGIFSVSNPINTATRSGNTCRVPRIVRNTPAQ